MILLPVLGDPDQRREGNRKCLVTLKFMLTRWSVIALAISEVTKVLGTQWWSLLSEIPAPDNIGYDECHKYEEQKCASEQQEKDRRTPGVIMIRRSMEARQSGRPRPSLHLSDRTVGTLTRDNLACPVGLFQPDFKLEKRQGVRG